MRKIFTLCLSLVFAGICVNAEKRSEYEMQRIAEKQLLGSITRSMAASTIEKVKIGNNYNIYGASGLGFVVISNDDSFNAVLGVSDKDYYGEFMPAGFKWWLNAIDESMTYYKANGISTVREYAVEPVKQLMTTQWGQDYPYNKYCPAVDGTTAPSGCQATAMAQIMKYHRYPETGSGMQVYTVVDKNGKKSTKFHRINTTYDWDNMRDLYGFVYTDAEVEAVSKLMIDCGAAVKMEYTSTFSGSSQNDAALALINNFGYNSVTMMQCWKMFYNDEEWLEMIHHELSNNRPLLYRGTDVLQGGHAFVFDGIDAEGKVHVNWGWNGSADGYYDFNNLAPNVGGATSMYNDLPAMVVGIKKEAPVEGEAVVSQWASDSKYIFQAAPGNSIDLYLDNMWNMDFRDFDGEILVSIENTNGKIDDSILASIYSSKAVDEDGSDGTVPSMMGFVMRDETTGALTKIPLSELNFSRLKAGVYRAYLCTIGYTEGEYLQFLRCPGGVVIYTIEKNEDGTMKVYEGDPLVSNGIEGVMTDKGRAPKGIYNLNGMRIPSMQKGLNIIKTAEGKAIKVMK